MTFDELITEHRIYLEASGYAQTTARRRWLYLKRFLTYLDDSGLNDMKQLTGSHLEAYFDYLQHDYPKLRNRPFSVEDYRHTLKIIEDFLSWLEDTGQILIAPVIIKPTVSKIRRLPEILTEEEVLRVLESYSPDTTTGLRNRAILELFYSSGIRRSELINLNLSDYNLTQKELQVKKSKNRKDRIVPVNDYAAVFLEAYLKLVRPWQAKDEEAALFVGSTTGKRLTSAMLKDIVKKAAAKAGIAKKISCHTFRHTMATHLLRNKADLRHIQAILGHASLQTTQIYTHLTIEDLKETIKQAHPHGKKQEI